MRGASDRAALVWFEPACHAYGNSAARASVAVPDALLLRASRETRRLLSPSVTVCVGVPNVAAVDIQSPIHSWHSANSSRFANDDCRQRRHARLLLPCGPAQW